tara:strand:+ start:4103 stop:4447 length:345 start_codon:yes stop_codon:yes gene_type:complete
MNVNEFFKEAGATRNKRVICADGFEMSVQAHQSAYCSPRIDNAEKYTSVEIGFPSEREPMLIDFADEVDNPTGTVYGYVPVQVVNTVLAKHGGIVEGEVPRGVAPIPAKFTADI